MSFIRVTDLGSTGTKPTIFPYWVQCYMVKVNCFQYIITVYAHSFDSSMLRAPCLLPLV